MNADDATAALHLALTSGTALCIHDVDIISVQASIHDTDDPDLQLVTVVGLMVTAATGDGRERFAVLVSDVEQSRKLGERLIANAAETEGVLRAQKN